MDGGCMHHSALVILCCTCYVTGDLHNIQTKNIIPVDLNSFLFWDASLLAKFYQILGDRTKFQHYHNVAEQWKAAVTAVHWNENVGTWLDYDILNNKAREYFYPSNLAPLWTQCYDEVRATMK
jgi:alpha,alpha-trehalase